MTTPTAPPHLARLFPGLRLPWLPLGRFPTPLERLERLSTSTGADVWAKRDDLSGEDYGGNKVRKLELLLGRAVARGRRRIVTLGALGSHHALATTIYARRLGLEVVLVLYPQPLDDHVIDDLCLDHAFGARLVRARTPALALLAAGREVLRDTRASELVPPGGSSSLGTVGHVEAGLELAAQLRERGVREPDEIAVAFGTGGTAAGLALGLALAGLRTRVVAVRVVPAFVASAPLLDRLVRGARAVLRRAGARLPRAHVRLEIDAGQLGAGYGRPTRAARRAVERLRDEAGLGLETTYTGKAAAALLARARPGRRLVFWNSFSSAPVATRLAGVDPRGLPEAFHADLRAVGRLRD